MNIKMQGHIFIGFSLISVSFAAMGDYPIPVRDQKSYSYGFTLKSAGACTDGGQNVFLSGHGSENMKVGICRWMKSSTTGSTTFRHDITYYNVPKNSNTDILVGCSIPGSLIYKIIWQDIDTGYQPPDILQSSNTSLVLQRIGRYPDHYDLLNANKIKTITVSYRLGNKGTITGLRPGDSITVTSVNSSNYSPPFKQADAGQCE